MKQDWAAKKAISDYQTNRVCSDGGTPYQDEYVKAVAKLLRTEHARAVRVVRGVKARYAAHDTEPTAAEHACDDILRRLKGRR